MTEKEFREYAKKGDLGNVKKGIEEGISISHYNNGAIKAAIIAKKTEMVEFLINHSDFEPTDNIFHQLISKGYDDLAMEKAKIFKDGWSPDQFGGVTPTAEILNSTKSKDSNTLRKMFEMFLMELAVEKYEDYDTPIPDDLLTNIIEIRKLFTYGSIYYDEIGLANFITQVAKSNDKSLFDFVKGSLFDYLQDNNPFSEYTETIIGAYYETSWEYLLDEIAFVTEPWDSERYSSFLYAMIDEARSNKNFLKKGFFQLYEKMNDVIGKEMVTIDDKDVYWIIADDDTPKEIQDYFYAKDEFTKILVNNPEYNEYLSDELKELFVF